MNRKKLYTKGIIYSTDPDMKLQGEEDPEIDTLPPGEQLLSVKIDTKHRGGKVVTLINGFKGRKTDIEIIGKQLKSFCGTGGSVKNDEIIIQGDNREKAMIWLKKNGFAKAKKI